MTERNHARMGHLIPVLLFVLVFVLCCAVLTGVFLRASAMGQQTQAYNDAVQLCRNRAELYRAGDPGAENGWYDLNLLPAAEDAAVYRLELTEQACTEAAGVLKTAAIRVYDRQGRMLYELEAAVYLPEEAANGK